MDPSLSICSATTSEPQLGGPSRSELEDAGYTQSEPPDSRAWRRRWALLPPAQRRAVILRHVGGTLLPGNIGGDRQTGQYCPERRPAGTGPITVGHRRRGERGGTQMTLERQLEGLSVAAPRRRVERSGAGHRPCRRLLGVRVTPGIGGGCLQPVRRVGGGPVNRRVRETLCGTLPEGAPRGSAPPGTGRS